MRFWFTVDCRNGSSCSRRDSAPVKLAVTLRDARSCAPSDSVWDALSGVSAAAPSSAPAGAVNGFSQLSAVLRLSKNEPV